MAHAPPYLSSRPVYLLRRVPLWPRRARVSTCCARTFSRGARTSLLLRAHLCSWRARVYTCCARPRFTYRARFCMYSTRTSLPISRFCTDGARTSLPMLRTSLPMARARRYLSCAHLCPWRAHVSTYRARISANGARTSIPIARASLPMTRARLYLSCAHVSAYPARISANGARTSPARISANGARILYLSRMHLCQWRAHVSTYRARISANGARMSLHTNMSLPMRNCTRNKLQAHGRSHQSTPAWMSSAPYPDLRAGHCIKRDDYTNQLLKARAGKVPARCPSLHLTTQSS